MESHKQKIVDAALHFKKMGYLAAADGNFSYRLDQERILISPSGRNKEFIQREDVAMMDATGISISGSPSSERLVHLAVYSNCPEASWVFHAHPPYATAWSLAFPDDSELPLDCLPEVVLGIGSIPIVPYSIPGESELAELIGKNSRLSRGMILQRHGALSWGESYEEALNGMERIEHASKILHLARSFGKLAPLSDENIKAIREKRKNFKQTL